MPGFVPGTGDVTRADSLWSHEIVTLARKMDYKQLQNTDKSCYENKVEAFMADSSSQKGFKDGFREEVCFKLRPEG